MIRRLHDAYPHFKPAEPVRVLDLFGGQNAPVRAHLLHTYVGRPVELHVVDPYAGSAELGSKRRAKARDLDARMPANFKIVLHRHSILMRDAGALRAFFEGELGGLTFDEVHCHLAPFDEGTHSLSSNRSVFLSLVAHALRPGARLYHSVFVNASPFLVLPPNAPSFPLNPQGHPFLQANPVTRHQYRQARQAVQTQLEQAGLFLGQFMLRRKIRLADSQRAFLESQGHDDISKDWHVTRGVYRAQTTGGLDRVESAMNRVSFYPDDTDWVVIARKPLR